MRLAIFDLDNTLLHGDSDHAWGEFLIEHNIVSAQVYAEANDRFYQQYQDGSLNIHEYLQFALQPLTQHSLEQLKVWHDLFMQEKILPMMQSAAQEKLAEHKKQGDYLLIITATNLFVTAPIAQALQVDHILASEPEQLNGQYTGKVAGTPCFQEGKISRLQQWLEDKPYTLDDSYFYSDSHNDLPLLELVDNPVAVDPDDRLRQIASQKSWPIISFRD